LQAVQILKVWGINLSDLIYIPVFGFKDQKTLLIPEKNEIRLPALLPDGRLIPVDEIRMRLGRFPEKSKDGPFSKDGVFKIFDVFRVHAGHINFILPIKDHRSLYSYFCLEFRNERSLSINNCRFERIDPIFL
jgi:hypothetical protein